MEPIAERHANPFGERPTRLMVVQPELQRAAPGQIDGLTDPYVDALAYDSRETREARGNQVLRESFKS